MSLENKEPEQGTDSALFHNPDSTIFTEDNRAEAKRKSPKKKKIITVIAAVLVLCLVGGLSGWLIATAPEKEPASQAPADEKIVLSEKEKDDVQEITVTCKGKKPFVIHQKPAGGFIIDELKEFEPQVNRYNAIANAVAKLNAQKLVTETPENLADYGLAEPAVTLKVTFTDGTGYTLLAGDTSSTISNGLFMKFADRDAVYISSGAIFTNAACPIEDYISTTVIPALDGGNSADPQQAAPQAEFLEIELSGTVRKQPIRILPTPEEETANSVLATTYYIASPARAYINSDVFSRLSDSLFGVYASGVAYIHPTDRQIRDCGLDRPYSSVHVAYKGGSYTLHAGRTVGEICSVMVEGTDLIYNVPVSNLTWLTYQIQDLHTPFLYAVNITDLTGLEIQKGNQISRFVLNHRPGETSSDQEVLTVTCNGAPVNAQLFKTFYQVLITQRADQLADPVISKKPDLILTFRTGAAQEPIVVKFFPTGARTRGVEVNGRMDFQTSVSYIDNLMEDLEKLLHNESFSVDS